MTAMTTWWQSYIHMRTAETPFSLLHGLSEATVRDFFERSVEKKLPAKQTLFHQDDTGHHGYLIIDGFMRIERLNADGGRLLLNILGPGEFFGETAILTGNPRSAALVAHTDATLRVITKADFHAMLVAHPDLSERLLGLMGQRLTYISHKLEEVSLVPLKCRLAGLLLDFLQRFGTTVGKFGTINLSLTQSDLAEMVSSSREHVNKILKSWEDSAFIRRDGRQMSILNAPALDAIHENATL